MDKVITEEEAYKMYLDSGMEDVMPFRSWLQDDFVGYLLLRGLVVLDAEEFTL